LLTLRGKECLERADVVIYDYLASRDLLKFCTPAAKLISLGSPFAGRTEARAGCTVVRLKGGDPGVFGRLGEEAAALREAHIEFEVVPGVSTAISAGPYAGVAITRREGASCVAFVAGTLRGGADTPDEVDFAALAAFPGTLVFYMGARSAQVWSHALVAAGKRADTPVVVIRRATLPDQQSWSTTLGDLPTLIDQQQIAPPLVAIVGDVALEREVGSWFTDRPLFGQTVLVTRPEQQAGDMVDQLVDLGADVLQQPAIAVGPPADPTSMVQAIGSIDQFDWIVFSSRNGVDYFFTALAAAALDARALGSAKIAAIGPATAEALAARGLITDLAPGEYRAEALAAALAPTVAGLRVLLVRASRGREVLAEQLSAAGAVVTQAVAYHSRDVDQPDPEVAQALAAGRVDWTTVTSSAIARALVTLFGVSLRQTKLVAISPLTAGVLAELGYPAALVANEYTADGMIDAIRTAASR
jgi:uroporphyrinogen III methyltransferase/synthase